MLYTLLLVHLHVHTRLSSAYAFLPRLYTLDCLLDSCPGSATYSARYYVCLACMLMTRCSTRPVGITRDFASIAVSLFVELPE